MFQPVEDYTSVAVYDLTIVRFDLSKGDPRPIAKECRLKTVNELNQQLATVYKEFAGQLRGFCRHLFPTGVKCFAEPLSPGL